MSFAAGFELALHLLMHPWAPMVVGISACIAGVACNR